MISFLEKLDAQLDLYNIMAKEVASIEEERPGGDINDLISLIIRRKYDEYHTKDGEILEDLSEEQLESRKKFYEITEQIFKKNPLARKIYSDLKVVSDENGDLTLESIDKIVGITQFIEKRENTGPNSIMDEKRYKYQSICVSICSSIENFFSDLFKDYFQRDSQSKNFNARPIPFEELKKFESIEDARIFLIDEFLDGLFRKSFTTWIETALNEFNAIKHFPMIKEEIKSVNELFQRRNLYVHNGGTISEYYFKCVDPIFCRELKAGDCLEVDREYIENIIENVRKLAYHSYFCFYLRVKDLLNEEDYQYNIQPYIVNRMHLQCSAFSDIFLASSTLRFLDEQEKIIAKINYFLYHKLHDSFDSIRNDLINYDVKAYEVQYKMAKAILLDQDDAFELTKRYFDSLEEGEFLLNCDWPLMTLVRGKPEFRDYFNDKVSFILTGKKRSKRRPKGAKRNESN